MPVRNARRTRLPNWCIALPNLVEVLPDCALALPE
ncbi:hypothetical protein EDF77_0910 [Stenotrophomonas maltophilia]|jgi:hypothetical protein|nr:hypothetical protein [Stenotrophomonas chelatiphaga]MDR6094591.1 hypothetical protein [Stenotrophomonas sp. SORGH_AS_0321]ROQ46012.1 hypothetical protein EDF77_0910 [Stenotrophomonas maltophilia]